MFHLISIILIGFFRLLLRFHLQNGGQNDDLAPAANGDQLEFNHQQAPNGGFNFWTDFHLFISIVIYKNAFHFAFRNSSQTCY